MRLLAIDPGSEQSAWAILENGDFLDCGKCGNFDIAVRPSAGTDIGDGEYVFWDSPHFQGVEIVAIETLHPRGMPTALEEMETQFWAGRFVQRINLPFTKIQRKDEKMTLCGRCAKVTDANIRQAIIDRYGGKEKAIGKKHKPGPLYRVKGDCWQAIAVGITWFEMDLEPAHA